MSATNEFLLTIRQSLLAFLLLLRGSFLVFVVTLGVLFLFLSILLSTHALKSVTHGVFAGMFAIWGVSALVYGALGHIGLRLIGYH